MIEEQKAKAQEAINLFKNLSQEEKARAEGILIGMQIQKETTVKTPEPEVQTIS